MIGQTNINKKAELPLSLFTLLVALQKTPSLLGAECQGVGTTPLHANERGQTVRFVLYCITDFILRLKIVI